MIINCELCGQEAEAPDGLVVGQHVLCPYCGGKFSYKLEVAETVDPMPKESLSERAGMLARGLFLGWVDAYKRIFDFYGRSNRTQVCGFLVCQYFFDILVWKHITRSLIANLPLINLFVNAVFAYAAISLGVRRLHDIGRTGKWMGALFFVFPVLHMISKAVQGGISSTWFVLWLNDTYVYMFAILVLILICWVKGTQAELGRKSPKMLKYSVVGFVALLALFVLLNAMLYSRSKADIHREAFERNLPFHQISYRVSSMDSCSSTYFVNTDGPANAQFMLVYVMGRLQVCNLILYDDAKAAKKAQDYIEKRFELEGSLRSIGRR